MSHPHYRNALSRPDERLSSFGREKFMLIFRRPDQFSTATFFLMLQLADHLKAKDDLGRLPDCYWEAVRSAPSSHRIEVKIAPGGTGFLSRWPSSSPVKASSIHRYQSIPWAETQEAICWAEHELWQSPTENLNGIRIEMVAKIAFSHPELLVSTPQCASLGESLVKEFRALSSDIAVEHPAFGCYPGTAPLSALSFFVGGVQTLNFDHACDFVDSVFSQKCGAAVFSDAIDRVCRERGIDRSDA
jgi:hypothetical protein